MTLFVRLLIIFMIVTLKTTVKHRNVKHSWLCLNLFWPWITNRIYRNVYVFLWQNITRTPIYYCQYNFISNVDIKRIFSHNERVRVSNTWYKESVHSENLKIDFQIISRLNEYLWVSYCNDLTTCKQLFCTFLELSKDKQTDESFKNWLNILILFLF